MDSLNHARAHPVSWSTSADAISLIIRTPTPSSAELFNNYGAKPNAELILGYGFSISDNPEDTIVLKLGGASSGKWEVGRNASGVSGLWDEVVELVSDEEGKSYEDALEASQLLMDLVQGLLDKLPAEKGAADRAKLRPEVVSMLHDYVRGELCPITSDSYVFIMLQVNGRSWRRSCSSCATRKSLRLKRQRLRESSLCLKMIEVSSLIRRFYAVYNLYRVEKPN